MLSQFKKSTKIIFIISGLMMPLVAAAQQMDTPQIDGFTNDTTFSTTMGYVSINSDQFLGVYFSLLKNVYYIDLQISLLAANHGAFQVIKGNNVNIKLQDNTMLNLSADNTVVSRLASVHVGYYNYDCQTATVVCALSMNDIYRLSYNDTTGARIQSDTGNIDFGIPYKTGATLLAKMLHLITTGS